MRRKSRSPVDPSHTTRVVEFNDVATLEKALSFRDVDCVLKEPALTNIGIVLPEPGFHEAMRDITWFPARRATRIDPIAALKAE